MTRIPSSAYRKYAEGKLTQDELEDLEKMAGALADPEFRRTLAVIGATTLMTPALTAIGAGAVNKSMSAMDKITMRRDLRRILAIHPYLGDPEDPHIVMAYQSLRTLNPEYAKDPLIAGPLLQQMLQSRMIPGDPRSAPRMDPGVAGQLVTARGKSDKSDLARMAGQSLASGAEKALGAYASTATRLENAEKEKTKERENEDKEKKKEEEKRNFIYFKEDLKEKEKEELDAWRQQFMTHGVSVTPEIIAAATAAKKQLLEEQKKRRRSYGII
jgi:hypothetical protein